MQRTKAVFLTSVNHDTSPRSSTRHGWRIVDGLPENNFGWYAYRDYSYRLSRNVWYLIEGRTGLSVSCGVTLAKAVAAFTSDPVRIMTWCGRAANEPRVSTLPAYSET